MTENKVDCMYDSGSATGNQPACDRPADFLVTYHNGSYGPFDIAVCARHLSPMKGRVFPGLDSVVKI